MAKVTKNNCISIINPELCKEWDFEKNIGIYPNDFSYSSTKTIWWKCNVCGKSWQAQIRHRNRGFYNCSYCCSLGSLNPELASEWHPTKNGNLTPFDVKRSDKCQVWWKCSKCGNEWESRVNDRRTFGSKGYRCKRCHLIPKLNKSLAEIRPELSKEWDYNKNIGISPKDFTVNSTKSIWWICSKCCNEWESKICLRTKKYGASSCFRCRSLAYVNPDLTKEWDYNKNGRLSPEELSFSSAKKVWWKCSICKNEWEAQISNRNLGGGCPNHVKGVMLKDGTFCQSMVEAYFYLKYNKESEKFIHNKKYSGNFGDRRYDFYFPRLNTYVEITSYSKDNWPSWYKKPFSFYLNKIEEKRKYVEDILKEKFIFIQKILTPSEKYEIRKNCKVIK